MSDFLFKTQTEAVYFLNSLGLKIGKTKFNGDFHAGRIPCTSDKQFRKSDLLIYGETLKGPQPKNQESLCLEQLSEQTKLLSSLARNLLEKMAFINMPTIRLLDKWQEEAKALSEGKSINAVQSAIAKARQRFVAIEERLLPDTEHSATLSTANEESLFLGISLGIIASKDIPPSSILFLSQWIDEHPLLLTNRSIAKLYKLISELNIRERFSKKELAPIIAALSSFIRDAGLPVPEISAPIPQSPVIPEKKKGGIYIILPKNHEMFDHPDHIDFRSAFCFSGIFAFGEHTDCEEATMKAGGYITPRPLQDVPFYLVVGSCANPQWTLPQSGRKIEDAKKNRLQGHPTFIILEDTWVEALLQQPSYKQG